MSGDNLDDELFNKIAQRINALEGLFSKADQKLESRAEATQQKTESKPSTKNETNRSNATQSSKGVKNEKKEAKTNWVKRTCQQMGEIERELSSPNPSMQTLISLSINLDDLRSQLVDSIQGRMSSIESLVDREEIKKEHVNSLLAGGIRSDLRKMGN